ncbi:L,D-transpeptidase family protein [Ottowia testudinis]|uniref:L,D-transpeptidase family protein n=1 Tax=Ottowia testudinis TaxID=2816950 RepID=A0A975CI36_9BURK|nr:L,D-transpeptidase family protein [Ottowia testudinis]QTD44594.1 L,D-transpeptidase family protein [Ottowia testudinis]
MSGCLLAAAAPWAQAEPLWLDDAGRPRPAAREAVRWLTDAEQHGLHPSDYDASRLASAVADAERAAPAPDAAAQLDESLTRQVLAYLGALRQGRVDPAHIQARYDSATAPAPDLAAVLRDAVARGQLQDAQRAALPPWPQYAELQKALVHYRSLGEHPAWRAPLPALPGGKLPGGQRWAGLTALAERLQALGDLPAGSDHVEPYDAVLLEAVKSFQQRHALPADGVLGKATLDALAVTPAARTQQIALAMERLRLTPLPAAARFVTVNVPEFMLRAHQHEAGSVREDLRMRVIVGKALDTRTPLFDEDMLWIEFSPYWNIPPSIARKETVPTLRANPGYLAAQGMEFVGASGVSTAVTPENLDAVLAGQLRIRQRPGPRNALGDIKFMLPNNQNIYLHHTPSPGLFGRTRRDFSHGCVRIEEPVALAQWVLHDQPDWTEARIRQSMGRPRPVTAKLIEPVPVLMLYQTAVVADGKLHFVPDLYGLDKHLAQALRQP